MHRWVRVFLLAHMLLFAPCEAADWRVGVDQGFREPRLGIGFGEQDLRSEFAAKDLPGLDSPLISGGQRTLLEVVLIGLALRRVDPEARLVLVPFSNIRRGIVLLQAGDLDLLGQTLSETDVKLNLKDEGAHVGVLHSPPLIRRNEYELGVFTTANRGDIIGQRGPAAFRQLRGITVASWASDLALMRSIVGDNLVTVPRRDMIAPALVNKRGDFTFSFLNEPVVTRIGGELYRIPGFKVRVPDERSFYLGTHCAALQRAFDELFHELRQRRPDALVKALTRAGTFSPQYRAWIDLARTGT